MDFPDLLTPATALFLDFDGTLVDIADQPHDVEVPHSLVQTLGALSESLGGAVALISGRPIDQIDDFLRPLRTWLLLAFRMSTKSRIGPIEASEHSTFKLAKLSRHKQKAHGLFLTLMSAPE